MPPLSVESDQRITDFNRKPGVPTCAAGNQNIQPFYLTCGLNILSSARRTSVFPMLDWRAGCLRDQRHGQIDFTFKFINVTLQP